MENNEIEELWLEQRVHNITDIEEAIIVIKRCEEIIWIQKKKSQKLCWDVGPIIIKIQRQRKSFRSL